ncbi:MAG: hypothetical protein PSV24_09275, partial [Rhodoferax sp.]|nr:hypothetical protein [Rhodoferax sp.]
MFWRTALLSLLVLFGGVCAQAAAKPPGAASLNTLLFEVQLDKLPLTDSLAAFENNKDFLVPLGELTRLLTLGITIDPSTHVASGFILSEDRGFRLDPASGQVTLKDGNRSFDASLLRWIDDDLYVPSKLLEQWLPLDF